MQADIIQGVYDRRDALVLMPTGGGKSICYQIPALTLEGTTVVVSPLIALMKDQVEGLRSNGVPAAYINSTLDSQQIQGIENQVIEGKIKILYVSPEKLVSQGFQPFLKSLRLSLLALDEAHCISAWGHDFRPEYTQLKFLKSQFPQVPLLALTATADKLTRKDILEQLQLRDPTVFITSFDRPNISMTVRPGQKRIEQIIDFLKKRAGQSGIIYCLSRRNCEDLAQKLVSKGIRAAPYHAELPAKLRSQVQEDFINDRTPIVCATIAFGMGIDKSNVRFVLHYNLPRNLEGYYQEIGRAGRDGLPADALLFFSYADVQAYRNMIDEGDAPPEQKELKIAKLNRMYQFAEAPVCRRKTVLQYFGEDYDRACGNCDVCKNPPNHFDGTVVSQKALSALLRTGEKVGLVLLIDILRGSRRQEIIINRYDQIKTYGAGREYTNDEWLFMLSQMLHIGLFEIAYDEKNNLKVTNAGRAVLFDGKKVMLALPPEAEQKTAQPAATAPNSEALALRDELFEYLRALRRETAQQAGVPPYVVFSDATLQDMAAKRPLEREEMRGVSGVGDAKLEAYGDAFTAAIRQFLLQKGLPVESNMPPESAAPARREKRDKTAPAGPKISTYQQTLDLFRDGHTIPEIAEQRSISPSTIMGHLAYCYEQGEDLPIEEWVGPEEIDVIVGALPLFEAPYKLTPLFEHFNQRFDFDKIRWALAAYRRAHQKN